MTHPTKNLHASIVKKVKREYGIDALSPSIEGSSAMSEEFYKCSLDGVPVVDRFMYNPIFCAKTMVNSYLSGRAHCLDSDAITVARAGLRTEAMAMTNFCFNKLYIKTVDFESYCVFPEIEYVPLNGLTTSGSSGNISVCLSSPAGIPPRSVTSFHGVLDGKMSYKMFTRVTECLPQLGLNYWFSYSIIGATVRGKAYEGEDLADFKLIMAEVAFCSGDYRRICKDGVWYVESNSGTVRFTIVINLFVGNMTNNIINIPESVEVFKFSSPQPSTTASGSESSGTE